MTQRKVSRGGEWIRFSDAGPAREVTPPLVSAYVTSRRKKIKQATIQREMNVLRRAFNHGAEEDLLPPGFKNHLPVRVNLF